MKTNATRIFVMRIILFALLSLYFLTVFGQPGNTFQNSAGTFHITRHSSHFCRIACVKTKEYAFENASEAVVKVATVDPASESIYNSTLQHNSKIDLLNDGFSEMYVQSIQARFVIIVR